VTGGRTSILIERVVESELPGRELEGLADRLAGLVQELV